jgi:ribonucleotide monophosphatase NagD (HAD superfamily)
MKKKQVFVFDLDGTLCKHVGRNAFQEDLVYTDQPIEPVVKVLKTLTAKFKIVFLSGRTEGCREHTKLWIEHNLGIQKPELYMRESGDFRKDAIIKGEIYDRVLLPKYNVIGVFDDRLQVCRMLYEKGLFVFNVNQGLIEF